MKKKFLTIMLCVAMVAAFMTGCGSKEAAAPTEGGDAAGGTYTIGYNNFGVGAYPLDLNEKETKYAIEAVGHQMKSVNNNFTVDNIVNDFSTLIGDQVNGIVVWSAADILYPAINDLMTQSEMPFVLGDKFPSSEETIATLRENPNFHGAISVDDVTNGANIAQMAWDNGAKTAIIVAAAVGDTNHDARVKGFTEKFEALGGKVVGEVHCADPSEAVQKSGDILSAHGDADCLYGTGGDYSVGALSVMTSNSIDMPVYGTDITPDVLQGIRDGKIIAANGAVGNYCGTFAALLLINALDGHPILDENGQAPVETNFHAITVDTSNVDQFEELWINNEIFSEDELKNLVYAYNDQVTWQDYVDFIEGYDFESRVAAHQ